MRRSLVLAIVTAAIVGWNVALIASPLAAVDGNTPTRYAAALMYAGGSVICHQRPERSFHLAGAQLPVCARCMGLYLGGAIGALLWVTASGVRRDLRSRMARSGAPHDLRMALIALALPTIFSVVTAVVGWWDPGNAVRAWLALPLGAIGGLLLTAAAAGDLR